MPGFEKTTRRGWSISKQMREDRPSRRYPHPSARAFRPTVLNGLEREGTR